MKKIKLVYNPRAGDSSFPGRINEFVRVFQQGYEVSLLNIIGADLAERFSRVNFTEYSCLMVAGGDGTINSAVNALLEKGIEVPLAILPTGTSNDFADYLSLPNGFEEYYELIREGNVRMVDAGRINNRYFFNVCAGGFLTGVPHKTDTTLKNRLGRIAYYLKGLQEFPSFKPLPLEVTTTSQEFSSELFMFLVLNSSRAAGFDSLVSESSIDDGLFEFLAIRYGSFYEMINTLIEVFINKNQQQDNVILLKDSYFYLKPAGGDSPGNTDIDGEKGPAYPVEIEVLPGALPLVVPKQGTS